VVEKYNGRGRNGKKKSGRQDSATPGKGWTTLFAKEVPQPVITKTKVEV
jgi:hypothetical protein